MTSLRWIFSSASAHYYTLPQISCICPHACAQSYQPISQPTNQPIPILMFLMKMIIIINAISSSSFTTTLNFTCSHLVLVLVKIFIRLGEDSDSEGAVTRPWRTALGPCMTFPESPSLLLLLLVWLHPASTSQQPCLRITRL